MGRGPEIGRNNPAMGKPGDSPWSNDITTDDFQRAWEKYEEKNKVKKKKDQGDSDQ